MVASRTPISQLTVPFVQHRGQGLACSAPWAYRWLCVRTRLASLFALLGAGCPAPWHHKRSPHAQAHDDDEGDYDDGDYGCDYGDDYDDDDDHVDGVDAL